MFENKDGDVESPAGDSGRQFEDWWEDRNIGEKAVLVVLFVILGIGLLFLFGYIVMLLWNWLMPEIFGLKTLTYWQAWGMLALSCILFGRIGGSSGKSGSSSDRKRKRKLRAYMKEHQAEQEPQDAADPPKA